MLAVEVERGRRAARLDRRQAHLDLQRATHWLLSAGHGRERAWRTWVAALSADTEALIACARAEDDADAARRGVTSPPEPQIALSGTVPALAAAEAAVRDSQARYEQLRRRHDDEHVAARARWVADLRALVLARCEEMAETGAGRVRGRVPEQRTAVEPEMALF